MALKPYRFSNGVTIPKGTMVVAPVAGIHMDDTIYPGANEFDGFRFSRLRNEIGDTTKCDAVEVSTEFLHFGSGPHAWFSIL